MKSQLHPTIDSNTAAAYEMIASVQTDAGCVRPANEDSGRFIRPNDAALLARKGWLAIVADGMGGHSAGEVASRMAVEAVSQIYYRHDGPPDEALRAAFAEANRQIYEAAQADEARQGMGTTGTALVLRGGEAFAAHVGDSRLYMIREGEIYLLTEDHSAVMEMVKLGLIDAAEARHHPDKNVILRALGTNPEVEVSVWERPVEVRVGDQFLLCSDGLYDLVEDAEINRVVGANEHPQPACERLVQFAKERGGHDNITVALICVKPAGYAEAQPIRETRETEAAK